jgi:hypothetical protein
MLSTVVLARHQHPHFIGFKKCDRANSGYDDASLTMPRRRQTRAHSWNERRRILEHLGFGVCLILRSFFLKKVATERAQDNARAKKMSNQNFKNG